jgi:hypothetical protein
MQHPSFLVLFRKFDTLLEPAPRHPEPKCIRETPKPAFLLDSAVLPESSEERGGHELPGKHLFQKTAGFPYFFIVSTPMMSPN